MIKDKEARASIKMNKLFQNIHKDMLLPNNKNKKQKEAFDKWAKIFKIHIVFFLSKRLFIITIKYLCDMFLKDAFKKYSKT